MLKVMIAIAVAYMVLATGASHAAIALEVNPPAQTISHGQPLNITVGISGLGNGTALGAFDVNINFDSALLTFKGATFGDPVRGDQLDLSHLGINAPLAAPSPGTIELLETSFDPPALLAGSQASSFLLATLSFKASNAGVSPITLTVNSLADANGLPFAGTPVDGRVTIAVPEPQTWFVAALGLGLIVCRVRALRPVR